MKKLFPLILLLVFPASLAGQGTKLSVQLADSIVQGFVNEKQIPGMAISVWKDGEMVFSKGYGYADLGAGTTVDPSRTQFRIGSVSKTLTAAAMGVLIQTGRLDVKEEVQTYVPGFPRKSDPITVEQVAGHIAGIRHYRGNEFMSRKRYETVEEGLTIFQDDPLLFTPGTDYQYSSYGWNLISAVIEGASGYDFLPYMNAVVFDHLGMEHTMAEWMDQDYPHRTSFYEWSDGGNTEAPYVDNSYKWAGGGFIGTTEDLILFGVAHLDDEYLNAETQEILMTPLTLPGGESTNYGLGWRTYVHKGSAWLGHSGGSVGGSTMFLINKEHQMVIAYAINRSGVGFDDLHFRVAGVFLDEN